MIHTPKISVITPVYNGAEYLPDLIESVQGQTYTNYEHIIIDDGSTDDGATVAVLEQYAKDDPRIQWQSRENMGQYNTQNEGLKMASGDYVVVIAADDVFVQPDAFDMVMNYLKAHPDCEVVYGKTARMDVYGQPLPNIELTWRPSSWLMKHVVYAQHCSVFASRQFISDQQLFFDPSYRYSGDWDWLIRVFSQTKSIRYIKRFLSIIRSHDNQTSRTATRDAIIAERKRICKTYRSSYRLHVLITNLNNYRAMSLIAIHVLKTKGLNAMIKRVKRRLAR